MVCSWLTSVSEALILNENNRMRFNAVAIILPERIALQAHNLSCQGH
jgi:hypothetical protein